MELWPYQKEAIALAHEREKAYLALAPGMGKTLTSLSGMLAICQSVLLVAEKNEIENSQNFRNEIETHFPSVPYYSLRKTKLEKLPAHCVAGINPESLGKFDVDELALRFDGMIVDEATMAKNATSARSLLIQAVARRMKYVVLLSGTPMMNGAAEIYGPLLLLDHRIAGTPDVDKFGFEKGTYNNAKRAFEEIFANGHSQKMRNTGNFYKDYIWVAKETRYVRELRYLIQDRFFFFRKEDTKGIFKKKNRRVVYVQMELEWLAEYQKAWDDYIGTLRGKFGQLTEKQFKKKMENISELKKLIENSRIAQVNSRWKARQAVKDIHDGVYGDKRIVIFSGYVETDKFIAEELERYGISYQTFENVRDWKANGDRVLVGRIRAHGKGTNAPEACVALFTDMSFVPNENIQAENRIDRPEQKNEMDIVYYQTKDEDVDIHIRAINIEKSARIAEFMRPFSEEELLMMPDAIEALRRQFPKQCALLGI